MLKKLPLVLGVIISLVVAALFYAHFAWSNSKPAFIEKPVYIALGDSVAAGQGLSTPSDSSACNRTDESYPHYVAGELNYSLNNVACSGATISVGLMGPQSVNGAELKPQVNQLGTNKPRLITITIGANDVGWSQIITKCLLSQCGTVADTAQVLQKKQVLASNLQNLLKDIQDKTGNDSQTVLTGYYQVYPASQQHCSSPSGLTDSELVWLHAQIDILNQTIQTSTTSFTFSHFAAVDFSGHELCMQNPWVQSLGDSAPFHPTADGQVEIGKSVVKAATKN